MRQAVDKLPAKFILSDSLRNAGLTPGSASLPLSLMLLWSQRRAAKLNGLPTLTDASAEFILKAPDDIVLSLCPELAPQISRQWTGLRANDIELIRRTLLDALDSDLPPDEIAEMILEYSASHEWMTKEPLSLLLATLDAKAGTRIQCAYSYACRVAWVLSKSSDVELDVENTNFSNVLSILAKACRFSLSVRVSAVGTIIGSKHKPDHAVVFPPLGLRMKVDSLLASNLDANTGVHVTAEMFGAVWGAHLGQKRNIALVSNGFLFRTSSNDAAFKRELIQRHGLEAVVSLPKGILPKSGVALSALVFQRAFEHRREKIRFVNASEPSSIEPATLSKLLRDYTTHPLCVSTSIEEVAANGFNMSVDRYVLDKATRQNRELLSSQETVRLSDLADIRRPQAIPREAAKEDGFEVREAMLADIDNGRLSLPVKLSKLSQSASMKIENAIIKPGDILLSIKGTIGKTALITSEAIAKSYPVPIVPGQSFVIVRLRKGGSIRDPEVLFSYLRSPLALSSLQAMAGGSMIPNVAMGDLKDLAVPILSMETQQQVLEKYDESQDLQKDIDELRDKMALIEKEIFDLSLGTGTRKHDERS